MFNCVFLRIIVIIAVLPLVGSDETSAMVLEVTEGFCLIVTVMGFSFAEISDTDGVVVWLNLRLTIA